MDVLSIGNEFQTANNIFKNRLKLDCKFENSIYLLTINVWCCWYPKQSSWIIIDGQSDVTIYTLKIYGCCHLHQKSTSSIQIYQQKLVRIYSLIEN